MKRIAVDFRFLKEKLRMNTRYAQLEALQYFTS